MQNENIEAGGVRHQRSSKTLGVYISDEMLKEVKESAAEDNRSVSSWIVLACKEKLSREVSDTAAANHS